MNTPPPVSDPYQPTENNDHPDGELPPCANSPLDPAPSGSLQDTGIDLAEAREASKRPRKGALNLTLSTITAISMLITLFLGAAYVSLDAKELDEQQSAYEKHQKELTEQKTVLEELLGQSEKR